MTGTVAIVPTFNRRLPLEKTIDSLLAQKGSTLPAIMVVDNGSSDDTAAYLNELSVRQLESQIIIVTLLENTGSAGGFAEGLKEASKRGFDSFWFVDNDAVALPNTFAKLLDARKTVLADDDGVGDFVIGSMMVDPNEGCLTWLFTGIDQSRSPYLITSPVQVSGPTEVEGLTYSGLFFSAGVVSAVGYPLVELFTWGDDAEYCMRIRRAGFKIYLIPESRLQHKRQPMSIHSFLGRWKIIAYPDVDPARFYYHIRNSIFIFKKNLPLTASIKAITGLLLQAIYTATSHPKPAALLWNTLCGAAHGFTGRLGKRGALR